MGTQARELSFSVRPRIVLRHFGTLCLALAALTAVPLAASLAFGEFALSLRYLSVAAALAGTGFGLSRIRAPAPIQRNEALVVTALVFLGAPLAASYPMMGAGLGFLDALFEAVSAATTTGLTTLPSVEGRPLTFLLNRAWMQWYGGLGIVVLGLALILPPGLAAKRLDPGGEHEDDLVGGTKAHARRTLAVYAGLTAAGIALLLVLGAAPFDAVAYALSSVSTGGFSPHDQSLAALPGWPLQWAVTALCAAGAISLSAYPQGLRQGWAELASDLQLRSLVLAGVAGSALLVALLAGTAGWDLPRAARHGPLLAFSAQTTSGFSTVAPASLSPAGRAVLIAAMLVGGGIGSTAGGFKLLRLLVLLRLVHALLVRTCVPPHTVLHLRLGGRRLGDREVEEALCVVLLFILVVVASWLPFLVAGHDPLNALFEVVSATGTVGLSTGITGADLHPLLKGVLCADMLMGRLEILAWLVLFFPRTWFGKHREAT